MRCASRLLTLLLLLIVALATIHHRIDSVLVAARAAAATCAAPAKTLSFECDNKCGEPTTPCWLNVSASATNCTYFCYSGIYVGSASSFMFLIPFGNWTRDRLTTPVAPAVLTPVGDTGNYSWASNNILESISTMKLRAATDSVFITGGSYVGNYFIPGQVANVAFASDLLTTQTQVKYIYLRTLNLQPMVSDLAGMFPTSVQRIALNNDLIDEFPPGFSKFISLKQLVDASMGLDTIAELKLAGNSLTNVTLTNEQATFFANLANFTFDEGSTNKECYVYQQREIHGLKFCIADATMLTSSESKSASSLPLILGIVGGVVFVCLVIAVAILYRSKKGDKGDGNNTAQQTTATSLNISNDGAAAVAHSLWNDAALLSVKVNADDIKDIKRIGKGAFGDVWLVKYRQSQLLASKRLRKAEVTEARTRDFIAEIKLVAKLDHPKIVAFVGAAWTIEADLQALFEYMDGGDLRTYLDHERTPRVWTSEKVQVAIDVVEALVYVHSFAPPLVHRDLKSRNVLLSKSLEAKLTDFGVSRYRSENNTMTAGVGTGRWLAPEVISGNKDYGPAADVFSFGAVLSEIDTHALPYDDVLGPNGTRLADVALLQLISTGQLTPSFRASCPEKLRELAKRCCAFDPDQRPTATELAYALRTFKRDVMSRL
ncbi:Tkl protein kinase, partial [Globisporangium splendens]